MDELRAYTYDPLGRLTGVSVTDNEEEETIETAYAYDPVGNRVKETEDGVETLSTYNSLNQLQTVKQIGEGGATRSYTYDPNGNLIKESGGSIGNEIAYAYDVENRLEQATIQQSDGDKLVQVNRYNGDGQRIQKKEGGEETNYYYQGATVVATTDGKGALTSHHLLGGGNDIIASGRYGGEDNDGYYFYHRDYRNSTTTILDSEGKEVQSYRYGNFGETKSLGSEDFSNEICYTGGIYDSSTGLYYLNARYYDPANSRMLTQDTYRGEQDNPKTWHLYTYCANDPINYIDRTGHAQKKLGVKLQGQQQSNWCSMAALKMVLGYVVGSKISQTKLHLHATGNSENTGVSNAGVIKAAKKNGMNVSFKLWAVSWSTVKSQINKKRPILAAISWKGGGGHMVVIRGYQTKGNKKYLFINDPWPVWSGEKRKIQYKNFKNHVYGKNKGSEGKWTESIINCRKK